MPIVTKPYGDFVNNVDVADAIKVNAQINALYNLVNGTLDLTNLLSTSYAINESPSTLVERDASRFINAAGIMTQGATGQLDIQVNAAYDVLIFRSQAYAVKFDHTNGKITIGSLTVAMAQPTTAAWIAPTLLNGWVNYGGSFDTAGYYKDDLGIVHVKGIIKSGTATLGIPLLTLPAGYRPLATKNIPTVSNDVFGYFQISATGTLAIVAGTNSSFSIECSFRAEQ